jgi:branched-chain amino acid transport system substrate-binding protein
VAKAVRALRGGEASTILRLDYKRNTVDVNDAVARLRQYKAPIKAVVMVPTYRAAARFIEKTRDLFAAMIYTNVSFAIRELTAVVEFPLPSWPCCQFCSDRF